MQSIKSAQEEVMSGVSLAPTRRELLSVTGAFVVAAAVALILPTAGKTHGALLRETVTVAADEPIQNVPGKRLVSHIVDYPPGVSSAAHRHAPSAFIYAYVLAGEIRSQVNGDPTRVYRAGEAWFESPGAHHRVSANASDTEPARLLAVLIVDAADEQLVIPEAQ
jgi:quercetin dioxygenase-like cupin family protein